MHIPQIVQFPAQVGFQVLHPLGSPDISLSRWCQRQWPPASVEQRPAKPFFLLPDSHAQGRLGEIELFRRLGKAAVLVDLIDVLHIKLHI